MALFLAGLTSVLYGVADFTGGLATRTDRVFPVVVYSQTIGLTGALVALALLPAVTLDRSDIAWGMAAGLAGGIALVFFYQGLATGRVVVVAPVAALMSAVVPVAVGLALGERPSALASVGVVVSFAAIWLVSSGRRDDHGGPTKAWMGLLSGIGFGLFFVFIAQTPDSSGLWPLVPARLVSISLVMVIGFLTGTMRATRTNLGLIAAAGVLDMAANITFLLASRSALLSLVAVITSLYPAATVMLARFVLHERLRGRQPIGLGLAAAGVVLIALG